MLKELISQGNFALWPQISLALFFCTFGGILLWVRRKGSDRHYRYMADLALDAAPGKELQHDGR